MRSDKAGQLTTAGRIFRFTGCFRVYRDGGGSGILFRWWHPISWVLWLAMFPVCAIVGEPIGRVVPFRLKPYWRQRKGEIEWL